MQGSLPDSLAFIASDAFSLINFRGKLISDLVCHGVKVYALAPNHSPEIKKQLKQLGALPVDYSLARTGMNPFKDIIDCIKLGKILKKLQPQASFSYSIKPVIYGTIAALIANIPYRYAMIEGLGYLFMDDERAKSFKRQLIKAIACFLYRITLKQNRKIILLNQDDKKDLIKMKLANAARMELIPGIGLDLSFFNTAPLVTKPVTYILVARMLREKGVYDYIKAAGLIRKKYPETRFLLVGGTDLNPGSITKTELQKWHNEGIVEWVGNVDDVRVYLRQSSVFVLPSFYREGLPRSTQEAMAMGRPVITTDSPGCRETVSNGINGLIIPVRSPNALFNAMETFIKSPDLIESMGKKSREFAETNYDVNKINRKLLSIMQCSP